MFGTARPIGGLPQSHGGTSISVRKSSPSSTGPFPFCSLVLGKAKVIVAVGRTADSVAAPVEAYRPEVYIQGQNGRRATVRPLSEFGGAPAKGTSQTIANDAVDDQIRRGRWRMTHVANFDAHLLNNFELLTWYIRKAVFVTRDKHRHVGPPSGETSCTNQCATAVTARARKHDSVVASCLGRQEPRSRQMRKMASGAFHHLHQQDSVVPNHHAIDRDHLLSSDQRDLSSYLVRDTCYSWYCDPSNESSLTQTLVNRAPTIPPSLWNALNSACVPQRQATSR